MMAWRVVRTHSFYESALLHSARASHLLFRDFARTRGQSRTAGSLGPRHQVRVVGRLHHPEFGYIFRENARDVLNKQNPESTKKTLAYLATLA